MKCIYIDPPYNTGSAFEHYDDNLEHSQWLSLMFPRLELLKEFLSESGSIWISIDDREEAYLKIILDELYGRENFIANVSWQRTYSMRNDSKGIPSECEHMLVYAKSSEWKPNRLPRTQEMNSKYSNPDNDPLGDWQNTSAFAPGAITHQGMVYAIQHPFTGEMLYPTAGACWRYKQEDMLAYMNCWCPYKLEDLNDDEKRAEVCGISTDKIKTGVKGIILAQSLEDSRKISKKTLENGPWPRFFFTKNGKGGIRRKTYLANVPGKIASNLWFFDDVGHTDEAKKESIALFGKDAFSTPKPERLIQRILTIATDNNDLVLDSFLGSGTTVAVAQKMGRRYIGIEMGEHAKTHCIPRLKKVIDGEQVGVSENLQWQGGGGFTFYKLGEKVFDEMGAINPKVDFKTLAAYIWQKETNTPTECQFSPLLGEHHGKSIFLLYNGILGDKRLRAGNVLNKTVLKQLLKNYPTDNEKIIYGDACFGISNEELRAHKITFKQIPYDLGM